MQCLSPNFPAHPAVRFALGLQKCRTCFLVRLCGLHFDAFWAFFGTSSFGEKCQCFCWKLCAIRKTYTQCISLAIALCCIVSHLSTALHVSTISTPVRQCQCRRCKPHSPHSPDERDLMTRTHTIRYYNDCVAINQALPMQITMSVFSFLFCAD